MRRCAQAACASPASRCCATSRACRATCTTTRSTSRRSMLEMCARARLRRAAGLLVDVDARQRRPRRHRARPAQARDARAAVRHPRRVRGRCRGAAPSTSSRTAWDVVCRADCPNLGLGLDSFHVLAAKTPLDGSTTSTRSKIFLVQLSDFMWQETRTFEERIATARTSASFPARACTASSSSSWSLQARCARLCRRLQLRGLQRRLRADAAAEVVAARARLGAVARRGRAAARAAASRHGALATPEGTPMTMQYTRLGDSGLKCPAVPGRDDVRRSHGRTEPRGSSERTPPASTSSTRPTSTRAAGRKRSSARRSAASARLDPRHQGRQRVPPGAARRQPLAALGARGLDRACAPGRTHRPVLPAPRRPRYAARGNRERSRRHGCEARQDPPFGVANFRGWRIAEVVSLCDAPGVPLRSPCQPYYNPMNRRPEIGSSGLRLLRDRRRGNWRAVYAFLRSAYCSRRRSRSSRRRAGSRLPARGSSRL